MISSDVDQAPRSLADQLSDFSQRFDHDADGQNNVNDHETSSQKVYAPNNQKLTPATYKSTRVRYNGHNTILANANDDANSVAMTAKPNQSYRHQQQKFPSGQPTAYSKTLVQKQSELAGTQKRQGARYQNFGPSEPQQHETNERYAPQYHQKMTPTATRFDNNEGNFTAVAARRESMGSPAPQSRAEMDLQLRDLEYKISAAERKNQESFTELREQQVSLQGKLTSESMRAEENDYQLINEIQAFEAQVNGKLLKQKHTRKEVSGSHLKAIDEQSFQLTLDLAKIKKSREGAESRFGTEIRDLVTKIASQVDQERVVRQENFSKIAERLQSETSRVQEMVNLEKKVREETQTTLVRLVEELESNLSKEISGQTQERVENEESFMELLEQTCARIETDLQQ